MELPNKNAYHRHLFLPVLSEHFLILMCGKNTADIQMSYFVSGDSDAAP